VVSRRGQTDDAENRTEREDAPAALDGADHGAPPPVVPYPPLFEARAESASDRDQQADDGREGLDAPPQLHHLPVEPCSIHLEDVERDHLRRRMSHPAVRHGPRNTEPDCKVDVPGLMHEFAEAMVVSVLMSGSTHRGTMTIPASNAKPRLPDGDHRGPSSRRTTPMTSTRSENSRFRWGTAVLLTASGAPPPPP
jgi:hypothetical protein